MVRWMCVLLVAAACGNEQQSTTLLPLCAPCVNDTDCESGNCRQHAEDFRHKCSNACTNENEDNTCPAPAMGCDDTNNTCACPPIYDEAPLHDACVGCDHPLYR